MLLTREAVCCTVFHRNQSQRKDAAKTRFYDEPSPEMRFEEEIPMSVEDFFDNQSTAHFTQPFFRVGRSQGSFWLEANAIE